MKRSCLYPGSFDPLTHGHVDVMRRASRMYDNVYIGIGRNSQKPSLFTMEERLAMIEESCHDLDNIDAQPFDGLVVDFAMKLGVSAILRGLRSEADYAYEMPMAMLNRRLSGIEVVFVPTSEEFSYVSSSLVKEVASLGGNVSSMVPTSVAQKLSEKYQKT